MSKVTNIIKELSRKTVHTDTYLKTKVVRDLGRHYGIKKEEQQLWEGPTSGDLKGLLIAGYGDSTKFQGAGPTRIVQSAQYTLDLFAVKENVELAGLFGTKSTLDNFITELKNHSCFDNRTNVGRPSLEEDHLLLSGCKIPKTSIEFYGLITNVNKNGSKYFGDLVLAVTRNLGYGNIYRVPISTTMEALSQQKDKTENISLVGNGFQGAVIKSMASLDKLTTDFQFSPDYKLWVLTVDNV